jgi:hypothetical protein
LAKAEALPVKVGVQWVDDKGWHTVVKKKPEDIVAVGPVASSPTFILSDFEVQERICRNRNSKPSRLFGTVNTSAKTSPSEFMMKQSCLSFATSIPTQIMMIPPR